MTGQIGPWSAAEHWTRDEAGRPFAISTDDWHPIAVPSHWRTHQRFSSSDGPLLYRTALTHAVPGHNQRCWLEFAGAFYSSRVWLDGELLGHYADGYFVPLALDITEQSRRRQDHQLLVEVACPRPKSMRAKRQLTGVFEHWDFNDPSWNPGGLWRDVTLRETGTARISRCRLLCTSATERAATLQVHVELDVDRPIRIALDVQVGALASQSIERFFHAGKSRVELEIPVTGHSLWWPYALGESPLYDVQVSARVGSAISDVWHGRTGLRTVTVDKWQFRVNGERLFIKGTTLVPTRMALGEATQDEFQRDVSLAKAAGFDLVKVIGHVSRPELYDAADGAGLLVWQDLPLHRGYGPTVLRAARRQAVATVDLLGHHPSIALWCAHSTPFASAVSPAGRLGKARLALRVASHYTPSFNRTVLDGTVSRTLTRVDPTRKVVAHSGLLPGPNGGSDPHLYFGWYQGQQTDLDHFADLIPRAARFVGEFGAQAVPDAAEFMQTERWPHLDWSTLAQRYSFQSEPFDRYARPAAFASFDAWRSASQRYQADVCRSQIEALRVRKYQPVGGFVHFCLNDGAPGVTWSLVDHAGTPKLAYYTAQRACQSVIVVARGLRTVQRPGEHTDVEVHVVNDSSKALEPAHVQLTIDDGPVVASWRGSVPPDSSTFVGRATLQMPDADARTVVVHVSLDAHNFRTCNDYAITINEGALDLAPSLIERLGRLANGVRRLTRVTQPAEWT